jgi:hydrophobic/amphiphilic exporter-1 (mainly G- bacteria), HAE1 family
MSTFFIDRPIFANVIAIIIVILGAVSLLRLPISQYPNIVPPTIQVTTTYPGASAEIIANTVGIPIENQLNGVEGSIYMQSTSGSDGTYTLTVTFEVGTDLNAALTLVQNFANAALSQLPSAVQAQGVTVRKVSTNILQVVSLYSDDDRYDETYLSNYAVINLQYPLGRVPGVGQIAVKGAGAYGMRIWLNPDKLKAFNLTALDVQQAIEQQNAQVIAGQLGGAPVPESQVFQFTVNALGRLSDVSDFENIIVKSARGESAEVIRVKDVARVELSQQSYSNFSGLSGKKAAHIVIYALPGANALDVAKKVRAATSELSKDFPEGLKYAVYYDTTIFVEDAISAVYHTLFEAGILVLIVIFVFLQNARATLIPAVTIPVTIIGAFAAMAMLGFSINLMTLFAVILAIGIVVDDAIIVVENSSHYMEKGLSPRDAAVKAMGELSGPIVGVTLVLTAVFIPASFIPGITGQLFRQFALVIASTAVLSALIALTLSPAQVRQFLRPPNKDKKPNKVSRIFFGGFNKAYQAVENGYMGVVGRMVARPLISLLIFVVAIGVAGWRFAQQPTGFLPTEDQGYAIVFATLPNAAARPRVREASDKVDAILKETPGVANWVTIGGLSVIDNANVTTTFTTFVIYESWEKRGADLSQGVIVADLKKRLAGVEEAAIAVFVPPPIAGLGQSGGFQMMIQDRQSAGLGALQNAATETVAAANSQSGLRGVITTFSARSPQIYLDINRTKAESLGVPIGDVFQTLQANIGSVFVNLFNKFGQSFQVRMQADAPYRLRPEDVGNLYVRNNDGEMVPLGTMIDVRRTVGSELVTRYNLYPAAAVLGEPAPGFSSGQALDLMEQTADATLPAGMAHAWTATAYQERQVGNTAYLIYGLSIVLVFLVLAAQYESWKDPAAVILVVPMAMIGVLLALMARHFDNNLYSQVGLVLLIGLASKNAILIVEFARELRAEGKSVTEAAVEATRRRFRAIVMTSFAFILGVVPLLTASSAGAASQQAIGTVVFGGMLAAVLLAIPFVPVFYVLMQGLGRRGDRPAAAVPVEASTDAPGGTPPKASGTPAE